MPYADGVKSPVWVFHYDALCGTSSALLSDPLYPGGVLRKFMAEKNLKEGYLCSFIKRPCSPQNCALPAFRSDLKNSS
jgi:hypothetical protein